jgi:hypothetical protein
MNAVPLPKGGHDGSAVGSERSDRARPLSPLCLPPSLRRHVLTTKWAGKFHAAILRAPFGNLDFPGDLPC